ncbi:MAG: hypothetical protein IKD70_05435, partial [Eggerthellaceae bacterium]|nr:hypothetical protein [Eggerthellaceae bacterium]
IAATLVRDKALTEAAIRRIQPFSFKSTPLTSRTHANAEIHRKDEWVQRGNQLFSVPKKAKTTRESSAQTMKKTCESIIAGPE